MSEEAEVMVIVAGEVLELPRGPRRGDLYECVVERLNEKGVGIATLVATVGPQKQPRRYRMRIRKGIPGDRVRVSVEKCRKGDMDCRIDALVTPSEDRITPRCQHFGRREQENKGCGGCSLQSLGYEKQLENKRFQIRRFFENEGLDPDLVKEPIGVDDPWFYRNKMEFSFGDNPQHDFAIGLHPIGYRHDVLALQECYLQSAFTSDFLPDFSARLQTLQISRFSTRTNTGFLKNLVIREGKRTGERLFELLTSSEEVALKGGEEVEAEVLAREVCELAQEVASSHGEPFTSIYWTQHHVKKGERTEHREHHIAGSQTLREVMKMPGGHELSFEIHPRAFFQPNTLQAERLYAQALAYTALRDASGDAPAVVLDLYCGTGTIGLCMAPYVERVVGIELNGEAVENARGNAARNGIENARFFAGDVGEVLASEEFRQDVGDRPGLVVVDPPRAGLVPAAREQLGRLRSPRIVYVSCNPKSLARDLADLSTRGYIVREVQPVDMFPQTYHVENVALLELAPGAKTLI